MTVHPRSILIVLGLAFPIPAFAASAPGAPAPAQTATPTLEQTQALFTRALKMLPPSSVTKRLPAEYQSEERACIRELESLATGTRPDIPNACGYLSNRLRATDLELAEFYLRKACAAGEPVMCTSEGIMLQSLSVNGHNYREVARMFLLSACRSGDMSGCSYLADQYTGSDPSFPSDPPTALALLSKVCDTNKDKFACQRAKDLKKQKVQPGTIPEIPEMWSALMTLAMMPPNKLQEIESQLLAPMATSTNATPAAATPPAAK